MAKKQLDVLNKHMGCRGYLDIEPEDITESPSSRAIALTPNQLELLQIFSAFPDNEQQEIIKELRNKKKQWKILSHVGWRSKVAAPDGKHTLKNKIYQMGVLEISALRIRKLLLVTGWSQQNLRAELALLNNPFKDGFVVSQALQQLI